MISINKKGNLTSLVRISDFYFHFYGRRINGPRRESCEVGTFCAVSLLSMVVNSSCFRYSLYYRN